MVDDPAPSRGSQDPSAHILQNLDVQSAVDLLWYDMRRGVIVGTASPGLSAAAEPPFC